MSAWENLLAGKTEETRLRFPVRGLIHESWERCISGGIDEQRHEAPLSNSKDDIEHLTRNSGELLGAARRSFAVVGSLLDGTGAMMVLADEDGVLIDVIGDKRTIHNGMDIHLGIGGKWTEDVVGTNGIGTALWAGEPVFVHAAEHFCAGIKSWTCAGAPIRDPFDGKIIGVVDLSGHPDIFRPHNTALVAAAAREIEKALAEHQNEQRTRLLEAFIAEAPSYRRTDGLIIVDHLGRAIYCSKVPPPGLDVFSDPAARRGRRLLPASGPRNIAELTAALPDRLRACHVSPLTLEGEFRGAALVFPASAKSAAVSAPRRPRWPSREAADLIVGQSDAMLSAIDIACRVAQSSELTSLLIEGETGVGKELFARLVHLGSRRSENAPFIALNCGAITRELFGSELFGHVAGAFTGASRDGKAGAFELANGGVLCLDEIGEMPLDIQPFLLRVLEERVVHRLGDNRGRPVDVRLIASTNRDLKQEVAAGRFRRDLYYRISTVVVSVPPLREREGDIPLLLDHFNRKIAERTGAQPLEFSADTFDMLIAYSWPGNVRELKNLVERLHVLAGGERICVADLPREIAAAPERTQSAWVGVPAGNFSIEKPCNSPGSEERALRAALEVEHGNLSRVAVRLGISRPTLYRKLDQYGIRRSFT
ncbi:sigma-54-dependent Fis family transcriptional regulator [Sinorhizobium sp. 7-81]|uniref:sigma-54-dependent Fis family transcriptional regulator n=1 Tax=Sinorhizobium sp. 8-89 TaxID=3049089 RepID=UPI0024C3EA17|nr:sigma-54-dependent Fis family transcriptional regulator [Sinorhizobium sp. 8-89]MDK1492886.1 sigma-54-dependent Fis family transcriptional regulator [Sinorhizobium sp. 8-89]